MIRPGSGPRISQGSSMRRPPGRPREAFSRPPPILAQRRHGAGFGRTSRRLREAGSRDAAPGGGRRAWRGRRGATGDSPPPNRFDPSRLRPGDRFMGLEVVSRDVSPYLEDTSFVGVVRFRGEVALQGTLRPHPEQQAGAQPFPCFYPDSLSALRLPRFPKDARIVWFCFTNQADAERIIGDVTIPREASVIIDDHQTVRMFTDAYDTARLVRVSQAMGPENNQ